MKKITLSLFALSSLLFGYEPFHYDHEKTDGATYVTNQTIVNNVVNSTNKVDLATSEKKVGTAVQFVYAGDVSVINIPLGMNIGSNYGVEVNMPIVQATNSVTNDTETGIGDISVGGNYHFGFPSDSSGNHITTLTYKTTTGDENKGLGSGKSAYTLSHAISKDIKPRYQLNGSFAYTLNDDSVSGNSYLAMFGGSMPCLFSRDVTTSAKLTYFHIDSIDPYGVSFGEVNSADLWLGWSTEKFSSGIPLGFGLKIPVLNEMDGVDKDKTILFYLSASSFF